MFNDYYEILGVGPDASIDEIKKAFRQRAQESHPDHHPDNYREQTEETRLLIEANATLTNARTRKAYDEKWKEHHQLKGKGGDKSDVALSSRKKGSGGTATVATTDGQSIPFWKDIRLLIFALVLLLIVLTVAIVNQHMNRVKVRTGELSQGAEQEQSIENIPDERLDGLLEAIERDPGDLQAISRAVVILHELGEYDRALEFAEMGLETVETRSGGQQHLRIVKAQLLNIAYQSCIELDYLQSAREYLIELLELAPENIEARDALDRLEQS